MQHKLIIEQERADKAKAAENEKRSKVIKMEHDFEDEQKRTSDIVADLTR